MTSTTSSRRNSERPLPPLLSSEAAEAPGRGRSPRLRPGLSPDEYAPLPVAERVRQLPGALLLIAGYSAARYPWPHRWHSVRELFPG